MLSLFFPVPYSLFSPSVLHVRSLQLAVEVDRYRALLAPAERAGLRHAEPRLVRAGGLCPPPAAGGSPPPADGRFTIPSPASIRLMNSYAEVSDRVQTAA